mgnify:FL=1
MLIKKDNIQVFFNLLSQVILQGTNFILIMIFTRYMSTSNYGVVSIYQAYSTLFIAIIGLSIQGTIGAAFAHLNEKQQENYLASIYLLACVNYLIVNLVLFCIKDYVISFTGLDWYLIILMLAYSFGNFSFNFISIKYVYKRKAQVSCLLSLFVSVLMIGLSWLSIVQKSIAMPEYLGRILGLSCPYVICIFITMVIIFREGNPFQDFISSAKFCLPMSLPLVLHSISSVFLGQTDKIMLQKLLNEVAMVGIYSFIVTFVHLLNSVYVALNNTWLPIYYDCLKYGDYERLKQRTKKYLCFFSYICVGFIMVAPEIVKLFANPSYWSGIAIIPLSMVSIYFIFTYTFAVNFELYSRKTNWIAIGTILAAIFNVFLNYLLIPILSIYGAAFATCFSYLLLFLFHHLYAKKISNNHYIYDLKFFVKDYIFVFIGIIMFYVFANIAIVRWCFAIVLAIVIMLNFKKNKVFF